MESSRETDSKIPSAGSKASAGFNRFSTILTSISSHRLNLTLSVSSFSARGLSNPRVDYRFFFPIHQGSVQDVWYLNSYGKLTIQSVLTGWIDVTMTEKIAAAGDRCAPFKHMIDLEIVSQACIYTVYPHCLWVSLPWCGTEFCGVPFWIGTRHRMRVRKYSAVTFN